MNIVLNEIVIRDFQRKDAVSLYSIVREREIIRFMKDWSENASTPEELYGFIDWLQTQRDSVDVQENKRYAIALRETDQLIGMVGMGLEDTLNEIEVAYFMCEQYQRRGYTKQAVKALTDWCFTISNLSYLILTIDCANVPSCKLAEKCGFELFEKRTPIGHIQPNMESNSYYYYRLYRKCASRCAWVDEKSELYTAYHDNEWGVPIFDDGKLYEMFLLECFQAGLSWITILKKRESFRMAFDGFDVQLIAQYGAEKVDRLLSDASIIRSRGKISAAICNAKIVLEIQKEFGSFSSYLWGFTDGSVIKNTSDAIATHTDLSDRMSLDMKKRGMKYVGSVTIYSFLQAVGIVNDHETGCFKSKS
ncbi:MAG: GNAT family N-acetyltransferase [Lachnospiraceae bacterium]